MRILLIGNYSPDRQESMLRFAALMDRELSARGHTVRLLAPRPRLTRSGAGWGKWLGYADKFLLFPFVLRRALGRHDVVHICDHSNAMYTRQVAGMPTVVTCHDVLAIRSALGEVAENRVSSSGRTLQRWILRGLQAAGDVVCVSTQTQVEMLRVTGRSGTSSSVVYNSLSYPYSPMPREEALRRLAALGYDAGASFFLHVGAATWYKNRLGLLQIYEHLQRSAAFAGARLLLVGGALEPSVRRFVQEAGLDGKVSVLSGLAHEDLRAVYTLAEALIFPSLQEGFGWPVLEAQACGCPVFSSGRAPMTEVGGEGAVYFDPADPAAAASLIADALPERERLCRAGFRNLERFGVEQMIAGYERAYQHVLARTP